MIQMRAVQKRYGTFQALHPLDLDVHHGEVFGFLGPNGAGKTTTIRMLAGVLVPTAGEIRIDGLNILQDDVEARRRVGYIPDRPYLYEKLTAREFMAFVAGIYGLDLKKARARGDALLAENDLLKRADELIEAYSHGMKQRLVLSAALLHEPRLLIVDALIQHVESSSSWSCKSPVPPRWRRWILLVLDHLRSRQLLGTEVSNSTGRSHSPPSTHDPE